MAAGRNPLKDKLEEDELDLSMSQLTEVPVKDIEALGGKVVTVNLSHNLLTCLPATFPLLAYLTKLDLSKNQLTELPENFGSFKNLRNLDLYANKIEKLPVSFAQLRSLKWLDLKDNPLCPALQQAAGKCITPGDCALAAKKVVALLQSYESQLQRERQRRLQEEAAAQAEAELREERERERVRLEKRAMKEKRREEARLREAGQRARLPPPAPLPVVSPRCCSCWLAWPCSGPDSPSPCSGSTRRAGWTAGLSPPPCPLSRPTWRRRC